MRCPHCRGKIPEMKRIRREYCCKELEVLSVHVPMGERDDTPAEIDAFARREGINFPIGVDRTGATLVHYDFGYLPHGVLIDPTGMVAWSGSMSVYDAEDAIREALGRTDSGAVGVVATTPPALSGGVASDSCEIDSNAYELDGLFAGDGTCVD